MNIYQSSSLSNLEEGGKTFVFPFNQKFLLVSSSSKGIQVAEILDSSEIQETPNEFYYFDLGIKFNLLPQLSDEMIDEAALIDFMNWDSNQRVYSQFINKHNIELQFQTSAIEDHTITQVIPSVKKHHIASLLLSITKTDGVYLLIYLNKIFITVVSDQQIKLCNIFDAKTDEEVLYYLMLIYQELSLSQEDTATICYGEFPEQPSLSAAYLSKYIRNSTVLTFDGVDSQFKGILKLLDTYHENH
ncbi:DUF3822 family protein [Parvicella tangerina]|uniref:DUF3822 family protein n=1 Tax=Parvicella tangerina TaxID=2829795 RepID=A0A916JPI3_9FLAO|nr:DUF3822 family protein [Parvicella tangerina]CAG5086261.1 hypothetical protein CRYO30217_03062 [Parvicella tangerina]